MKNKILLITPDRNDRPELLEHCRYQMSRQTVRPYDHIVVNFEAVPGVVDIVPRIRKGVTIAQQLGADICMIIENDDYYPDNYVEVVQRHLERFDVTGCDESIYYSLQGNCMRTFRHPGRSSLYLTSFRTDAFKCFTWPEDEMLYFDLYLWTTIPGRRGFINFPYTPIGMKHGSGFSPGNYHNGIVNGSGMKGMVQDPGRNWLKKHTRKESFEFYQSFMP
jgi:hypothetical protein